MERQLSVSLQVGSGATHPVWRTLSIRERKGEERNSGGDEEAADPVDTERLVHGAVGRDEEEGRNADEGADAGRDVEDGAPGDGRVLGQACAEMNQSGDRDERWRRDRTHTPPRTAPMLPPSGAPAEKSAKAYVLRCPGGNDEPRMPSAEG